MGSANSLRRKEGDAANRRSRHGRLGDRLDHAARLSGPEIVADDRLRALTDADDRHEDQHHDAIDDAERRDGDVAAEAENEPIEDDHDGAHAELHGEGRDADRRDLAHDGETRPHMAQPQLQDAPAAEEESQHPHRGAALADRRRQRRPLDAPAKHEDEDVAENEIDPERQDLRRQRRVGIALRAHDVVEAEADMQKDARQQDDADEIVGVGQHLRRRAHDAGQQRVEEMQDDQRRRRR